MYATQCRDTSPTTWKTFDIDLFVLQSVKGFKTKEEFEV